MPELNKTVPIPRYLTADNKAWKSQAYFKQVWEKVIDKIPFSKLSCVKEPHSLFEKTVVIKKPEECDPEEVCRYDLQIAWWDECKNGHNTFSIRLIAHIVKHRHGYLDPKFVSVITDQIYSPELGTMQKYFPEFVKYLKYRLFSVYGPLYYFENTAYFASDKDYAANPKEREIDKAVGSCLGQNLDRKVFELSTDELMEALTDRLPAIMAEFKQDIEELGFVY